MTLAVYVSIADAPLDTPPPDIGDDGIVDPDAKPPKRTAADRKRLAVLQDAPAVQHSLIVPFTRLIKFGTGGIDVKGAKRAIWRANGIKPTPFTPVFGSIAVKQLRSFQSRHELLADGVLGPETLHALAPYFDQYAFLLYEGYSPLVTPAQAKRQKALAYLLWGYNNRASIYYLQARPMTLLGDLEHLPISEDCSTFYTKMAKFARWEDPNGFRFNGVGNTTSLVAHGRRVDLAAALLGDAVFYSYPAHVGGYVGHGRIISLGSTPGPSLTPVFYRHDYYQTRSYL